MTAEREKISDLIARIDCHFTIDQLLRYAEDNGDNISRATVYRTVQLLLDSKLLIKLQRKNQPPIYETTVGKAPHYHLVCTDCGAIIEFENSQIDEIAAEVCKRKGFHNTKMMFTIFGSCDSCAKSS